ncbi:MAG TPA: hypothetical protein VHL53_10360, partial [Acidimicrobiia bacterium]|nr:hypothetical protein [Acidimicrobiia bacterium]
MPGTAGWGEPPLTAPARPAAARRPLLVAALVGGVVGALVAGLLVAALKNDRPGTTVTYSANSSKIARTGDVQEILAKIETA